ncbi:MAG: hypothetical protein OHK0039_28470 [Bacteroidia bacterium]
MSIYPQEPWIAKRILAHLNRIQQPGDLQVPDAPDSESTRSRGYGIGETVSQRIIDRRQTLPGRRYTSLSQLDGIAGLGEDKLGDLFQAFRLPAAEAFAQRMRKAVLPGNFTLSYDAIQIPDEKTFHLIVQTPSRFTQMVGKRLQSLSYEYSSNERLSRVAVKLLESAYLETFDSAHIGAYAFALWFYRFDADNWFGFEQVRSEIEPFLDAYEGHGDRLELRLYKGFDYSGLLAGAITSIDLPVVVNYAEQEISIWWGQLND